MTDNPCPEYWDDLWDLKPNVLLAGSYSLADVVQALSCASRGERLRRTPYHQTPLTPAERAILHHCAMALKSKEIAEKLGISERTVQNALSSIYGKLGLRNRAGAILYYWGMGHLIPKLAALE